MNEKIHCPSRKEPGFSLIEVVMALGVVAFAIVAIMGLLPTAVTSANDSKRESRAAFIAQGVFANLQASPFATAKTVEGGPVIDMATASTSYLAFDTDGQPLGAIRPSDFITGLSTPSTIDFVARLSATPVSGTDGLTHVDLRLESPAPAAEGRRRGYTFVSLIGNATR